MFCKKYNLLTAELENHIYEYSDRNGIVHITVELKNNKINPALVKHLERISIKNRCIAIYGSKKIRLIFYSSLFNFAIITLHRK
ncbi:MAG: hypothetical protein EVJ46_06200 [Candidatus Acididesulfobacter guangdongensis]|uniref:Uncharacterized protein n=1 Tax=Acididesulfobacter guangdongensis TaxID=2597225 RepID=A0A519BH54_ACIG2|nr:MAG: hypothetical protein EVJ46_06200 [Candidatus Acididesulfobacter guangdongensis]